MTIATMPVGSHGYSVAWAMWRDTVGRWWLHPDYCAHTGAGGTAQMLVRRLADGYHVWPRGEDHPAWRGSDEHGYVGTAEWIPVAEVHKGEWVG